MKRSEIIHRLFDFCYNDDIALKDIDDAAKIIDFLEAVGMLPPLNQTKAKAIPSCDLIEFIHADNYYEWEPEDEKK